METSLGLLIVKIFKALLCAQSRRAGNFNVYEANKEDDVCSQKLNAFILQKDTDMLIGRLQQSSDMSGCCRSPLERRSSPTGSIASTQSQSQLTPSRQLSDGERLKKVILELIDTERTYVKHLNNLLENYLEPLRNAPFLSSAEVSALFGNIREIVAFQRLFLQALTEAIEMEPGFVKFEHPYEFKHILFSISSAFLYYATQFKLYSSFCASHSKAQKVLHPSEGNQALQEFLMSRNPRQQHSSTLESYLIKPIQRILKYPLLLQQLKALTEPGSDEHRHLLEALKVMEKVAEHINEMQRIHEEYGAIFDHLFRQHQKSCKQAIDLSPGDLLYYGGVEWLNISDFLGKIKKGLELHAMCFVFKTAVVFLCKERLRQKKKLMGGSGKNSSSEVEIIRYQVLIPVTEVQVRASSMKDMDNHFLWELIHLKSQVQRRSEKVYHLSNSTSEFRNAFLKTIRQIIRESVRNMNIPPNKPPSSGSSGTGGGTGGGMGGGPGSGRMNTSTLQPSRSGGGKKKHPQTQTGSLQRHSGAKYNYDSVESYDNVPETQPQNYHPSKDLQQESSQEEEIPQQPPQKPQQQYFQQSQQQQHHKQLISQLQNHQKKQAQQKEQPHQQFSPEQHPQQNNQHTNKTQQHPLQQQSSSGSYDSDQQQGSLRTRSKTMSDAMDELSDSTTRSDGGREDYGTRSEGEEESSERKPISLGRTPNHLSLSTTSTLSTGSTGSQARLIQASNQPSNYQPVKSLGSPIWKPRENFGSTQSGKSALGSSSTSLSSRCGKSQSRNGRGSLSGGNNNAPGGADKREGIYLPRTNPPPFSYIGSSFRMPFTTSSLPKSHSSLDLQSEDDYLVSYKSNSSAIKNQSTIRHSLFNRNAIFEEESSYNSSEINFAQKNFNMQCKIPGICTVTTYSKKDMVKNVKFLSSNSGVTGRNNFNLCDIELSYSKSKSLEPSSPIHSFISSTPEFYSRIYNSHRKASSNDPSPFTSPDSSVNSTFIKHGTSFKLIENSLIRSDSSLDLSSLDENNKGVLTKTQSNTEDTVNKLPSNLMGKKPSFPQSKTRTMDKSSYLDHILHKLEEINGENIKEEKRNSSISAINRISNIYEFSSPPKPPARSSSYIEKSYSNSHLSINFSDLESVGPSNYSETRQTAKKYADCQPSVPKVLTKNNENYSASIDVLNKTAQTIDSLVSQLQSFK